MYKPIDIEYTESNETNVEQLFHKLKDYGDTRIKLLKLQGINKASGFMSTIIMATVLSIFFFLVLLCITIGGALLIGSYLGNAYYGFFIVAGVYLIIGLILYLMRTNLIKTPISNKLIREIID